MSTSDAVHPANGDEAEKRRAVIRVGLVTSNKMTKTVVVTIETQRAHKVYGRTVRRSSKFMAHDPEGKCAIGDRVEIKESRPLSKNKRWRVVRIVEKGTSAQ